MYTLWGHMQIWKCSQGCPAGWDANELRRLITEEADHQDTKRPWIMTSMKSCGPGSAKKQHEGKGLESGGPGGRQKVRLKGTEDTVTAVAMCSGGGRRRGLILCLGDGTPGVCC